MEPVRPAFLPDPDCTREEMEELQREIARVATFEDDLGFDPATAALDTAVAPEPTLDQARIDEGIGGDDAPAPVVAGVDQAFLDDRAVSGVVATRGGRVAERVHAVQPISVPYVPGLLSFREGGPIVAAFESLSLEPDVVLYDGSGRIHYRQAGLATHLGVVFDLPSVGVAKSLLCGRPRRPVDVLSEGERVAIDADDRVEAARGTLLGYAVQTRQFPGSRRVNPVYVSPGHRVGVETAADLALALCVDVKLPEPIRLADEYVGEVRDELAAAG